MVLAQKKKSLELATTPNNSNTGELLPEGSSPKQPTQPPESIAASNENSVPKKKKPAWDKNQNHGRKGFNAYWGCENVVLFPDNLKKGMSCPGCEEHGTPASLYESEPGHFISLKGQPIITGTHYHLVKLRCSVCGKLYVPDVSKLSKYDETCRSTLAIYHYYLGMPMKRIELSQVMQGVPVSDSTQWQELRKLAEAVLPVYSVLEKLAAEGTLFHYDDTPMQLLTYKRGSSFT